MMGEFQSQTLIQGFDFLIRKKLTVETAQRIKTVIDQGRISSGTEQELVELVFQRQMEILESLKSKKTEDDIKQQVAAYEILANLLKNINSFNRLLANLRDPILEAKRLLEEIRREQQVQGSEKVFLEAILRVVECASISPVSELSREFPLLGVLIDGLSCWEIPTKDWDAIGQHQNCDAIDIVLKGAIVAMDLDPQRLVVEAELFLKQIQCDEDLNEIEAALSTGNLERKQWACKQLLKIRKKTTFFMNIPKVPANPQWERAKNIELPIQLLKDALDHPSVLIKYNAALILVQKIGEAETMEIMRAKNVLKDVEDI